MKKPRAASAMTVVANHPNSKSERGNVSPPITWGFMATIIMTAISGAASTPLITALQ